MSSIVKWELRKQMFRSRLMILSIPMILLMMLIATAIFPVNDEIIFIYEILLIWGTLYPIVTCILNLVNDLLNPTYLLERSTSRNYLPVFFTKIGCNIIYYLLATFVTFAGEAILARLHSEHVSFFAEWSNHPYFILMLEFSFVYPIGIMFAYLVGAQFSQSKLIRGFMMLVAGILLYQSSSFVQRNEAIFFVVALLAGIGMLYASNIMIEKTI